MTLNFVPKVSILVMQFIERYENVLEVQRFCVYEASWCSRTEMFPARITWIYLLVGQILPIARVHFIFQYDNVAT